MQRGRKPLPNQIKKVTGSKHYNPDEPALPRLVNARVPSKRLDDSGKRFWKDLAPVLIDRGVITIGDLAAFEMLCNHYSVAVEAARIIHQEGLTSLDEHGAIRKHPLLQVLRDSSNLFRSYAVEFGLTPSSRSRLKVNDGNEGSLADILFSILDQEGSNKED